MFLLGGKMGLRHLPHDQDGPRHGPGLRADDPPRRLLRLDQPAHEVARRDRPRHGHRGPDGLCRRPRRPSTATASPRASSSSIRASTRKATSSPTTSKARRSRRSSSSWPKAATAWSPSGSSRRRASSVSSPQLYSLGVKELIKVTPEQYNKFTRGRVVHAMGYPIWTPVLGPGMFGGGIVYAGEQDHLAVGMIVGLDWKYHDFNTQDALVRFKEHKFVKQFIEGGTVVEAGAKMIPEGGWYAVPRDPETNSHRQGQRHDPRRQRRLRQHAQDQGPAQRHRLRHAGGQGHRRLARQPRRRGGRSTRPTSSSRTSPRR